MNDILETTEYSFLKDNKLFGDRLMLVVVSGSIAYGTNNINSDLDIRAIGLDTKEAMLMQQKSYGIYQHNITDTVIMSHSKLFDYLIDSKNASVLEWLYSDKKNYLYINEYGKILVDAKDNFVSKKLISAYLGFVKTQINTLRKNDKLIKSKSINDVTQYLNSITAGFNRYENYIDNSIQININNGIRLSIKNLDNIRLEDMINMIRCIHKCANGLSNDSLKIMSHRHICKTQAHTLRMYEQAINLFLTGKIVVESKDQIVRNCLAGDFIDTGGLTKQSFYDECQNKEAVLKHVCENSKLRDEVDITYIQNLRLKFNQLALEI